MKDKEDISKELFDLIFCQAISYNSEAETKAFLRSFESYYPQYGFADKPELFIKISGLVAGIKDPKELRKIFNEVRERVCSLMGMKTKDLITVSGSYITGSW